MPSGRWQLVGEGRLVGIISGASANSGSIMASQCGSPSGAASASGLKVLSVCAVCCCKMIHSLSFTLLQCMNHFNNIKSINTGVNDEHHRCQMEVGNALIQPPVLVTVPRYLTIALIKPLSGGTLVGRKVAAQGGLAQAITPSGRAKLRPKLTVLTHFHLWFPTLTRPAKYSSG